MLIGITLIQQHFWFALCLEILRLPQGGVCFVRRHITRRRQIVFIEALNTQSDIATWICELDSLMMHPIVNKIIIRHCNFVKCFFMMILNAIAVQTIFNWFNIW